MFKLQCTVYPKNSAPNSIDNFVNSQATNHKVRTYFPNRTACLQYASILASKRLSDNALGFIEVIVETFAECRHRGRETFHRFLPQIFNITPHLHHLNTAAHTCTLIVNRPVYRQTAYVKIASR